MNRIVSLTVTAASISGSPDAFAIVEGLPPAKVLRAVLDSCSLPKAADDLSIDEIVSILADEPRLAQTYELGGIREDSHVDSELKSLVRKCFISRIECRDGP